MAVIDDAPESGPLGDLRQASTEPEVLDLLAVWLAEVSAEAVVRRPASEAEPPMAEPTR